MVNFLRKREVLFTLLLIISWVWALRANNMLQDNTAGTPSTMNGTTLTEEESKNTPKQEPGVIRTTGGKKKVKQPIWAITNYIDIEKLKTVFHSQKEIILYCSCIVIMTSIMLIFIKVIKSKYHTNKFNEKDLFNARSLFKTKGRQSHEKRGKSDEGLKTILEDANESWDVENGNNRDTWKTIYEDRSSHPYTTFSVPARNSDINIDGERLQGNLRRNYHERKTGDEPEIISAFSADKSEDYAVPQRNFMNADFGNDKLEKAAYLRAKERALFGSSNHQNNGNKMGNQEQVNTQIKFNFSETESEDDDLSETPKHDDINNAYGRETLDLNGPMYDPATLKNNGKGCMSEFSQAESETNDVNKILHNMETKSFKGFDEDDISNSVDSRMNEGAMLRSRHQNRDMEDLFF